MVAKSTIYVLAPAMLGGTAEECGRLCGVWVCCFVVVVVCGVGCVPEWQMLRHHGLYESVVHMPSVLRARYAHDVVCLSEFKDFVLGYVAPLSLGGQVWSLGCPDQPVLHWCVW